MKFEKFQTILKYNKENQEIIEEKVKDFYRKMGVDYEKDLLNLMIMVRPLFNKKRYLVLEMPFKDKEIGAICCKRDVFGYLVLNSTRPKVNVNFALAHEIFHVFYQEKLLEKRIELYMNEHYFEHEEEFSANLFAGIMLMPTPSFEQMYKAFLMEHGDKDSYVPLICKLMSYYEVPYMAVVIRAYELGLLPDGECLQTLLAVTSSQIEEQFAELWLDDSILHATGRDNYLNLERVIRSTGDGLVVRGLMDKSTIDKILQNVQVLYEEIKE